VTTTAEGWRRIKAIIVEASTQDPSRRPAFLAKACAGDAGLLAEVSSLLESMERVGDRFDKPDLDIGSAAPALQSMIDPDRGAMIGRRIGPYEIQREIGRGGMGAVYLASRADREFTHEVALKIIKRGMDTDAIVNRFRTERQILADLEHPHIARLLDGGTTDDGLPYLVMEYVNGEAITTYCDKHRLNIAERLTIFRKICDAVAYAHQRLVVHRDLKPSNVLVSTDGVPKLLDFGLAKILNADTPATETVQRWMTPGFASPEQLRGDRVTTVSDVYSLGLLLYELLCGTRPFGDLEGAKLVRAVLEDEPEKPSLAIARAPEQVCASREATRDRLRRRLQGDLDNIVLMALQKEPSRRYASVEQFSEDIRRHLERMPIQARGDTPGYRLSKFVQRHKGGVIAAAIVVFAVISGLGASLYESHLVRQQAEIARTQRARAERRFDDVRKLANSLIFDVHDSIKDLPGATQARKLVSTKALEYLDSLSQEAAGDPSLQRELAAAYDRVGDVLGYDGAANLGDYGGAIQAYEKALGIRESMAASNPSDMQVHAALLNSYFHFTFALESAGRDAEALDVLRKALPVAQKIGDARKNAKSLDWLAGIHWRTAKILARQGAHEQALNEYRTAAAIREPIAGDSDEMRTHLAADYNGIATTLWQTGRATEALTPSRKAMQILGQLSSSDPDNVTLREYLGESYLIIQPPLAALGELDESLESARQALSIFESIQSKDPQNLLARANAGFAEIQLGEALILKHRISEAMSHVRRSTATFASLDRQSPYDVAGLADSYFMLAMAYKALGERAAWLEKVRLLQEERNWLLKSVHTWDRDPRRGSPDPAGGHNGDRARQELAICETALAKF
jgi:serine/threonine protein kinase